MGRRRRRTCSDAGRKCDFDVAHEMIHHSLDGRVFRVQRLVCAACGRRVAVAKRQPCLASPAWRQDDAVEANF